MVLITTHTLENKHFNFFIYKGKKGVTKNNLILI